MKYEALPNLPTLGPKFKGSKSVTEEIKKLTHEALEKCKEDGFVKILEHNIEIVNFYLILGWHHHKRKVCWRKHPWLSSHRRWQSHRFVRYQTKWIVESKRICKINHQQSPKTEEENSLENRRWCFHFLAILRKSYEPSNRIGKRK